MQMSRVPLYSSLRASLSPAPLVPSLTDSLSSAQIFRRLIRGFCEQGRYSLLSKLPGESLSPYGRLKRSRTEQPDLCQFFAGPSASVGDGEMVRAAVPS